MVLPRWFIPLCLTALACTPKLNGTCASNSDCHPGESCSAAGLCLLPGADTGNGNGDAGGAGASIEIIAPTAGAVEKGSFHVSAQTASAAAIQDVTFYLTNASSGAAVGQQVVATPSGNHWSGTLTLNATAFGGSADLVAVMHRTGLADVTSAKVTILVDQNAPSISPSWNASQWWALDAGITVIAAATDDRSGVVSASLILPDGGTASGALTPTTATFTLPASAVGAPGAAVTVPVSLGATDLAGNSTLRPDASTLSVDDQPPAIALVTLDSTVWRNGLLDVNAGVGDGTGSGLAGTSLLLNGAFTPGTPDGGGGFNYHVDLSALPATEAVVGFQVVGVDRVGNQADAGFNLKVDNILPIFNGVKIETPFDGTDAANQGWFQGPTAAPSAGAIAISAVVSDSYLVMTGTHRPAAIINGTSFYGTLNALTGRWGFSIPRSVGLNASAPVAVSFDAQDLAGNHPNPLPSLSLQFDDVPASSFTPVVAADTTWHVRAGNLAVNLSFGAAPRSGFASVLLTVASQADVICTSSSPLAWSCPLPTTDAPAAQEGALAFSAVAKSITKVTASAGGSRKIDDLGPVISNSAAIPYPAGALWGHDGSHFTLRDSGTIYTFTAYDCGAGVGAVASFGFSPQLATRNVSLSDSGAKQSCANGNSASIYNVAVTGDLSTSALGAFAGADNSLDLSVTVKDGLGQASVSTKTVNATRRLWRTANIGAGSLALGPTLAVGQASSVTGLRLSDGASLWTSNAPNGGSILAGPVVGGTAANPVVFYGSAADTPVLITAISPQNGVGVQPDCGFEVAVSLPASCGDPGGAITDPTAQGHYRTAALAVQTDGTLAFTQGLLKHGFNNVTSNDCGNARYWAGTMSAGSCSLWFSPGQNSTNGHYINQLAIGRSGHAFLLDNTFNFIAAGGPTNIDEINLGSATLVPGSACSSMVLADNAGSDSALCSPARYTFTGSWSTSWSGGGSALITAPAQGVYLSTAGYNLSTGALAFAFTGTAVAVDWSSSVVYLSTGSALVANAFNGGTVGAQLFALPSTGGTDAVMDKSGILYVISGGQVLAMATDTAGLTAGAAWPVRARDACRSSNLEYACPY